MITSLNLKVGKAAGILAQNDVQYNVHCDGPCYTHCLSMLMLEKEVHLMHPLIW